jgi:hypothetical protein
MIVENFNNIIDSADAAVKPKADSCNCYFATLRPAASAWKRRRSAGLCLVRNLR